MPSGSSPCAACKFAQKKCTKSCILAPYFPQNDPYKFLCVRQLFGVANMRKMLKDIVPEQREAAVKTMVREGDARITNPVYGIVGYIHLLQQQIDQLRMDLYNVNKELATYIGPAAFNRSDLSAPAPATSQFHHPQSQGSAPFAEQEMTGIGLATGAATPQPMIWDQSQSQMLVEARPMVEVAASDAAQEQQMLSSYDQQQQPKLLRLSSVEVAASDAAQEQEMLGSYDQQQQQELLRLSNVEQLGGWVTAEIAGVTVEIAGAMESAGGLSLHPPSDHHQNLASSTPSKEM